MEPRVTTTFDAEGQQRFVSIFALAAAKAAGGSRAGKIAVHPFDDTAGESASRGFAALQIVGDPRPLVAEHQPVLGGPAISAGRSSATSSALWRDNA
jgi:hypothetical protein